MDLKVLLFTSVVLATAYAKVLSSDQEPVGGNITPELDLSEFYNNLEAEEKDKPEDAPLPSTWSDAFGTQLEEADIEDLLEFLPVGSNYANEKYKINELLDDEIFDTTGFPETSPSAATLLNMLSSRIWILYAIVVAIMNFKSF